MVSFTAAVFNCIICDSNIITEKNEKVEKIVCICLNLLIGIIILFINIIIAFEMVGEWGIISKTG